MTAMRDHEGEPGERTTPSQRTRAFEEKDAHVESGPDRGPAREEEAAADRPAHGDEQHAEVAAHYREMAERGVRQRGEGRIP